MVNGWWLVVNYQLPTTNYQLLITNYQLPTTNYQLLTTNKNYESSRNWRTRSFRKIATLLSSTNYWG
ncbi:MAG: hypothetical protein ACHBN1_23060 [Heteroscytonema crispum UTEX LB 1556]